MSTERRPTKSEVYKAARDTWNDPDKGTIASVALAVADLFGGAAPDPVEVPKSTYWWMEKRAVLATDEQLGSDRFLDQNEAAIVTLRSNAWEEIKGLLNVGYNQGFSHTSRGCFKHAIDLMSAPEMGVGPKLKGD